MFKMDGKIYMWVEVQGVLRAMRIVRGLSFNTITQKMEKQARMV